MYLLSLFSWQLINLSLPWYESFFQLNFMILYPLFGICLLAFYPNTWIHLRNLRGTNFLVSSLDFSIFSSSSQISYSSATSFTSIGFSFFGFFFLFSFFLCFFSSCFFFFSYFASSSFCLCHPNLSCLGLYCFPHSSGHLIIFTSIFQSISGLWWASHNISKITFYFCSPII